MSIPVFFLILKKLFTIEYAVSYGLVMCGLYYVEVCPLCTHFVTSFGVFFFLS